MHKNRFIKFLNFLLLNLIIIGGGFAIYKQQDISDWWKLRDYVAPPAIQQLSSDINLSDYGKRIFYVSNPQIQDKEQFYVSCEENETTIVLGCYKPQSGIYILNVDDPRLNGIEQVTAAHELLHAAYERLSDSERNSLNADLNAFYKTLNDQQITSKIQQYEKVNANISNELHSILGTEVISLNDNLEKYYSKYFKNRSQIVNYAVAYQSVFTDRKQKLQNYDNQLAELEGQIKTNNEELLRQQAIINTESSRLNSLKANGNITEYNAGVSAYNNLLPPFRSLASKTQGLIDQYKSILEKRNAVAAEAQELNKALDSRIQSPSQQKI